MIKLSFMGQNRKKSIFSLINRPEIGAFSNKNLHNVTLQYLTYYENGKNGSIFIGKKFEKQAKLEHFNGFLCITPSTCIEFD